MVRRAVANTLKALRRRSRLLARPVPVFPLHPDEARAIADMTRFPAGGDEVVEGIKWIEETDGTPDNQAGA
jgi:hypothetical protein